jgi:hypothetical protein
LMLAFMLVSRLLLSGVRWFFMYYFDLATEESPKEYLPATLFGVALGVLIALVKCVSEVVLSIRGH